MKEKPITKYRLVWALTPETLQTYVEKLIVLGFEPLGGVAVGEVSDPDEPAGRMTSPRFVQAMVVRGD